MWRYSGKSRVIIEFFTTLIITGLVHLYLWQSLNMVREVETQVQLGFANEQAVQDAQTLVAKGIAEQAAKVHWEKI